MSTDHQTASVRISGYPDAFVAFVTLPGTTREVRVRRGVKGKGVPWKCDECGSQDVPGCPHAIAALDASGAQTDTSWFTTTPEASLRAESVLIAYHENRIGDIGTILAADYDGTGASPLDLVVALIAIADRVTDYAAAQMDHQYPDVIREAARIVATAVYATTNKEKS